MITVTKKDRSVVKRLLKIKHNSEGSYHMIAATRAPHQWGKNHIAKPSPDDWPSRMGRHAEYHLISRYEIKGETVYIVGRLESGNVMPNTYPCDYCAKILVEAGIRRVVFFENGQLKTEVL